MRSSDRYRAQFKKDKLDIEIRFEMKSKICSFLDKCFAFAHFHLSEVCFGKVENRFMQCLLGSQYSEIEKRVRHGMEGTRFGINSLQTLT